MKKIKSKNPKIHFSNPCSKSLKKHISDAQKSFFNICSEFSKFSKRIKEIKPIVFYTPFSNPKLVPLFIIFPYGPFTASLTCMLGAKTRGREINDLFGA